MKLRVKLQSIKKRGQTALEYALVIGVISVGVIFAGRAIFGQKDSPAEQLMNKVVTEASKTLDEPGDS